MGVKELNAQTQELLDSLMLVAGEIDSDRSCGPIHVRVIMRAASRIAQLDAEMAKLLKLIGDCRPAVEYCKRATEHELYGEGCSSPLFMLEELTAVLARVDAAIGREKGNAAP